MKTALLPEPTGGDLACTGTPRSMIPSIIETYALLRRSTRSVHLGENERVHLTVSGGIAWVTMEGDPDDYAVTYSNPARLIGPGLLVIEAVEGDLLVRISTAGSF